MASLSDGTKNSSSNGKWFHYYRDENEQYVGQVHRDGTVRMWACVEVRGPSGGLIHNAGAEVNVVDVTTGTGSGKYLYHSSDEDIQTLTLNDFTYLNNRTKTVAMDSLVEPIGNFQKEVFIELKTISYAKQYSLNLFDQDGTQSSHFTTETTATRINVELIKSSNNYCDTNGGMVARNSRASQSTRCDDTAGDGRDAFAPNVGTRIFSVDSGKSLEDVATSGSHTYTVNVNNNNSTGRKNLYFRIQTTGQSVPYSTGSGTSQETTYQARYTTTYDLLHGGQGWQQGDYFYVWMKDGYYKVTVEEISTSKQQANLAMVRPQPTPFDNETTITAESILGDIRTELINEGISANDITQIGLGLHIKRSTNFNASTGVGELLNVVAGQVNDIGDLPFSVKMGWLLK